MKQGYGVLAIEKVQIFTRTIFIILTIGIYWIRRADESRLTGCQNKYFKQNDLDVYLCIYYQSVSRFCNISHYLSS